MTPNTWWGGQHAHLAYNKKSGDFRLKLLMTKTFCVSPYTDISSPFDTHREVTYQTLLFGPNNSENKSALAGEVGV